MSISATCIPEMRKDHVLLSETFDITAAACGCPAGKGLFASCKHIGTLCYAFVEFCSSGSLPDFLTCTEKLQAWNKPKPKKIEQIPVEDFCRQRAKITNKQNKKQSITEYNPQYKQAMQYCWRTCEFHYFKQTICQRFCNCWLLLNMLHCMTTLTVHTTPLHCS